MALYLGFDSGTQSLTATVIEIDGPRRAVVFEHVLPFDEALPEYGTRHGVLTSDEGRTVVAPPAMWAEALDRMADVIARSGLDLSRIRAISGSAQQHGSVYLAAGIDAGLGRLDPRRPLARQIEPLLTRAVAPLWLDCSTTQECRSITAALGGPAALATLTGSRAYERFTAAQVRKFAATEPDAYAATGRIHLVSSFLASLLAGREAPLEPADASGMNLMDLATRQWAPTALRATAEGLEARLPPIRESWTVVGRLGAFWQHRHGFPSARVIAWSGDNPSSLIGLGLIDDDRLAISLGTSDTIFGPMEHPAPDPAGTGHIFGSATGRYMALTCFANGSLARERVRDAHELDWTGFSALLRNAPAGNGGALMLPWFAPEITPAVRHPWPHRQGLDATDAARNVRAVVEGQALAMRLHSRWMGAPRKTMVATGGAAANREILQVIADVFDAEVSTPRPRNSASLGAALRAYHADRLAEGTPVTWDAAIAGFANGAPELRVRPDAARAAVYTRLLPAYEAFEARALREDAALSG